MRTKIAFAALLVLAACSSPAPTHVERLPDGGAKLDGGGAAPPDTTGRGPGGVIGGH